MWAFTGFIDVGQQMQNNFAAKIEEEYGTLQNGGFIYTCLRARKRRPFSSTRPA